MKKDGSNQTKLTKGKLIDVVDGKLYGILEKTLFKTDLDGGFRQEIYKFDENIEEKYIIANGYIYFTDLHSIYRTSTDGRNCQVVYNAPEISSDIFSFCVDDYLWIAERKGEGSIRPKSQLIRVGLDGSNPQYIGPAGINIYRAEGNTYTIGFSAGYYNWYKVEDDKLVPLWKDY